MLVKGKKRKEKKTRESESLLCCGERKGACWLKGERLQQISAVGKTAFPTIMDSSFTFLIAKILCGFFLFFCFVHEGPGRFI
jgi:hypothetical protein